jgi:hypothetical protein
MDDGAEGSHTTQVQIADGERDVGQFLCLQLSGLGATDELLTTHR